MARPTNEQRIQSIQAEIDALNQKKIQLKRKQKEIESKEREKERAARTRRLIQLGALAEKYLDCKDIEPAEFEKLLLQIVGIIEVDVIIKKRKASELFMNDIENYDDYIFEEDKSELEIYD